MSFKMKWVLPLVLFSSLSQAADISVKCTQKASEASGKDSKFWSEKKGKTYAFHLRFDKTLESQTYSAEDLQCVTNENPATFHCWNEQGATVDLVSDYRVGYAYEAKTPQTYKIKNVVKYNFLVRTSNELSKLQQVAFEGKNCELKLK